MSPNLLARVTSNYVIFGGRQILRGLRISVDRSLNRTTFARPSPSQPATSMKAYSRSNARNMLVVRSGRARLAPRRTAGRLTRYVTTCNSALMINPNHGHPKMATRRDRAAFGRSLEDKAENNDARRARSWTRHSALSTV